jgi:DNA-binding CsgD family transcriptional regulator
MQHHANRDAVFFFVFFSIRWLPTPISDTNLNSIKNPTMFTLASTLTLRERQVLALVGLGLTTKEIADRLCVSHHTIESHRKNMLRKWDAKNSAELLWKASTIL